MTASRNVRVNLGNYEGSEIFTSITLELDEFDEELEALDYTQRLATEETLRRVVAHYRARGKQDPKEQLARRYGLG